MNNNENSSRYYNAHHYVKTLSKAGDTQARNLRKFSSQFLHSCVGKQYLRNMESIHNHRNLLENLCKFIAQASPLLYTYLINYFSNDFFTYHYKNSYSNIKY